MLNPVSSQPIGWVTLALRPTAAITQIPFGVLLALEVRALGDHASASTTVALLGRAGPG
jgi:hypothetical protein